MTLTMLPGSPRSTSRADHRLHQEERPAQVDRDVRVEQLGRGVQQRAARGQPGRVDQAVHPAVRGQHRGHRGQRLRRVRDVGADEGGRRAGPGQLGDQRLAALAAPAGHRHRRALPDRGPRHARADALGAAADQHDLAVEEGHDDQRATGSPGLSPVRCSRWPGRSAEEYADARPMTRQGPVRVGGTLAVPVALVGPAQPAVARPTAAVRADGEQLAVDLEGEPPGAAEARPVGRVGAQSPAPHRLRRSPSRSRSRRHHRSSRQPRPSHSG